MVRVEMLQFRLVLGKLIGFVSGGIAALMWNQLMWFGGSDSSLLFSDLAIAIWSKPFPVFVVAMIMVLLSVAVVIASFREHHRALIVLFIVSFFPIGISLFGADHWIKWIGYLNIGFLVAGVLMWRPANSEQAVR